MRARLKGLYSSDVDLESWAPGPAFGTSVDVIICPPDGEGEEIFGLTVCSPSWFGERLAEEGIRSGHHTIFVHEYNYRRLYSFVERAVQRVDASTWKEVAEQLAWLGSWEFSDYRP